MKGFKLKFKRWLKADVFIIVLALVGCHFAHYAIQFFYPVTGEPSYAWLYHTLFGLTRGSIILGYSYLVMRFIFPEFYAYFEKGRFMTAFVTLTKLQKVCIVLAVYFLFLYFFLASGITK